LKQRAAATKAQPPHEGSDRGYSWLYQTHVTQADEGCDFDFLRPRS
jgi:dihydroxy-acid dehydratase